MKIKVIIIIIIFNTYLKVNDQTKYKSVPIFWLFLAVEKKPEIRNY